MRRPCQRRLELLALEGTQAWQPGQVRRRATVGEEAAQANDRRSKNVVLEREDLRIPGGELLGVGSALEVDRLRERGEVELRWSGARERPIEEAQ